MREEKPAVSLPKVMVGRVEMRTPDDVSAMLALKSCGWGTKRIAAELGCSRNTVKRWLAEGGWRSASPPSRARALEGFETWLAERFRRHGGNADVVRQELGAEHGITVSLRTVERAVAHLRQELRAEARATVRFETRPGQQLQIDFGERRVEIAEQSEKVFLRRHAGIFPPPSCPGLPGRATGTLVSIGIQLGLCRGFGAVEPSGRYILAIFDGGCRWRHGFRDEIFCQQGLRPIRLSLMAIRSVSTLTLRSDCAAVAAALREPWSNGQTEGQINRLKTLKRQMYGRANIDLLRARLVAAS